jgi:hypothetical protein
MDLEGEIAWARAQQRGQNGCGELKIPFLCSVRTTPKKTWRCHPEGWWAMGQFGSII